MAAGVPRWIDLAVPLGAMIRRAPGLDNAELVRRTLLYALPHTFFVFWLCRFVPFLGGFVYMLGLVPLSLAAHIRAEGITARAEQARLALVYMTVILIGFGGIWSFIGHTFMADWVAGQIGWESSPFQTELAFFTLGAALAGLLALRLRDHLVTGLVVAKSVFWLGAAYVHLVDWLVHGNTSPLNIGAPLVGDLLYPALAGWLLWQAHGAVSGRRAG